MADNELSSPDRPVSTYREKNSTADRALDILALFSPDRLKVSAIDVANELSIARSTAYRYLLTLTSAGYLEEDPTGGFRLGLTVFTLARLARASYGLSAVALPVLRELAQSTNETALLTRRSGGRAVCLEREEPGDHRMRLSYERGSALTLNAGASAWVLLAWEEEETVRQLLRESDMPMYTDISLASERAIFDRLAVIREQGYAVTYGELDPDAIGVAAPVRDDEGRVIAGISVVALKRRVHADREAELVGQVRTAAATVSELVALTSQ